MNADSKTTLALAGLALVFLAIRTAFLYDLWGRVEPLPVLTLVEPAFTNTATVRVSAAELIRTGGDTSGLDCYTCHEKTKQIQLRFDTNSNIILPKEHEDLTIRHGRNNRNNNCYNCHDPAGLDRLVTRDGRRLKLEESTLLCAGCHGPTYRDWEAGIHGRTSGYWRREMGPVTRQECASCHNPHMPAFPSLKPAPGPHLLHPVVTAATAAASHH
ncbi:MAG: cytochrome c3 family protein [Limisphaerales bacterium]